METSEIAVVKCCPHCEVELSAEEIKRLWSSYTAGLRQTLGGPKRQKRACQSCGMMCDTARGAWSHCRIPRGLDAEELLAYVVSRIPKELSAALAGRHGSLETLQKAVADMLLRKLMKPAEKRQAKWYQGFIERAMNKLESAA